ncbi:MAG: hypothetical protein ACOX87_14145 [Chloroflexota bacterium]|jgi:vacuolar-type H+-ATPase subunit H
MDMQYLLDRLEAVLTSGSRLPLTGKTMIDEHECLDIIDQLRVAIPEEIKQAKRVIADRDRLIQDAEEQAKRIVAHSQEQVAVMVTQHEITKAAEAKARRILQDAEAEAVERKEGSDRYALETLTALEDHLNELLGVVRNGLRSLDKNVRGTASRDEGRDGAMELPPRVKGEPR